MTERRQPSDRPPEDGPLDRAGREQALLLRVSRLLASTLDLEAVLQVIADAGAEIIGVETSAVYLLESDQRLYLGATLPALPPDTPAGLRWANLADHPHIAEVVSSGEPTVLPDARVADLSPAEREVVALRDLRTLLFLPLEHERKGVGVLILGSTSRIHDVSPRDVELARALADQVSLALQNARLHTRLQEHAARLEAEISERIRVEEALRHSKERFRALFEQAGDYILVLELRDGVPVIVDANQAAFETHGYTPDELVGLSVLHLDRGLTPEAGEALIPRILDGESVRMETVHARKDGSEFPVEALLKGLDLGDGRTYILSIERDISERKRWEKELLRQQRTIALNHDVARVFLGVEPSEAHTRVLEILLQAFECDLGVFGTVDDQGSPVFDFMARDEDGRPHVLEAGRSFTPDTWPGLWRYLVEKRRTVVSTEGLPLPDGHPQLDDLVLAPIVHSDDLIGLIGLANKPAGFDDGDRALIESVAAQTAPILRALQEKSRQERERREVEEQLRQAQKMDAVGQLAGGVAHDFNNLLQVIQGHTELAMLDMDPGASAQESLESVRDAAERAGSLVHRLLTLSRHHIPDMRAVELEGLVTDLTKMIRRVLGEHIHLDVKTGSEETVIHADPGHIEQILLNLCVNARDAMPSGGTITISVDQIDLDDESARTRGLGQPGTFARLSVIDTGAGMDPHTMERIFEPFFSTKGPGRGTGLGLSTAYGLVTQHGGAVQVASEVGRGTTFQVYFPVQASPVPSNEARPATAPTGRGETLLLAEDDERVRSLSEFILTQAGYRVRVARDGLEAVEVFNAAPHDIDLVFLDVVMPGMGGPAVRDRLRRSGFSGPVVFASGYAADALDSGLPEEEELHFLPKPYTRSALLHRVRAALDGTRSPG